MSDDRPMVTDALRVAGKIIGKQNVGRDAVHIAVEPLVAARRLFPGQHIGIDKDGLASDLPGRKLGVVDPFLEEGPEPGEKFLMFIYPGTITSLRHVWEHPDFKKV